MQRRSTTWLALSILAAFSALPVAAQDNDLPEPTPAAADTKPADSDIGPPGEIVVPKPEEVKPQAALRDGAKFGNRTGDINIRAPFADVDVGDDGDGTPRVHVRAPYTEVRVNGRDGIHVDTPIGPINIGGRGGLNLRDLGERFGVRVEQDGAAIDPADALPARDAAQRAVLGVQLGDEDGIRIESVREGSPADKANLIVGDRLVSMNGYVFPDAAALTAEISRMRPGDRVQLTIEREGRLYRANATLEARQ